MKTTKFYLNTCMLLIILVLSSSCEDEFDQYSTIAYVPCENTNVTIDTNILSDFECQTNVTLPDVETVRNPAEIQTVPNKSCCLLKPGSFGSEVT